MPKDERGPHLTQIYCENPNCAVRQIEVSTKDHLSRKPTKDPKDWRCPVCGGEVTVHWRRGRTEQEKRDLQDAIGVVNAALYEREHGPGFPLHVMALDGLPESWKCVEVRHEAGKKA